MVLGANTSIKAVSRADFAQLALALFALLTSLIASGSVFLNDLYFWGQSHQYINPYLFLIALLLGLPRSIWGLMGCIFLLPLSAGLGNQLNAYLGTHFLLLPNAGLDLAAGFFLGSLIGLLPKVISFFRGRGGEGCNAALTRQLAPWPVALVIVLITISTAIAISRNVYQSAAATSLKGLLFNLVHFRPIGWHDDYMPISDWVAYALAVAMVFLVIGYLKDKPNKNQIIFRPIIAGLIVAALMGISQAITGLGLPENLLSFRKDQLGHAVIGFQPDLHAFAGHMLLGGVGLWGYFYSGISKLERKLVLFAVAMCWVGLILSKSRALFLLALVTMFVWLLWSLWQKKSHLFLPAVALLVGAISIFIVMIFNYSNHLSGIPVLSWLGELANEFKSRDLTSWSLFSGIFGSRFEIWEAAIRMWWEFPLMGIGQGNFYRLSDIASFSKSHFLIQNHGENAHNYFLQTLTETGLVGATIFLVALLLPIRDIKNKKELIPAAVAMSSLFLGNIFSHAFLVRENLILLSTIVGLIYALTLHERNLEVNSCNRTNLNLFKRYLFLLLALLVLVVLEIYKSYGRSPFVYGIKCFNPTTLYLDGWTGGEYQINLPPKSRGLELIIQTSRPNLVNLPLEATLEDGGLNDANISLEEFRGIKVEIKDNNLINLKYLFQYNKNEHHQLRLHLSNCYTPRNYGHSTDSRRLGVVIKKMEIIYE